MVQASSDASEWAQRGAAGTICGSKETCHTAEHAPRGRRRVSGAGELALCQSVRPRILDIENALDVATAQVGAVLRIPGGCGLLRAPEADQRLAARPTCWRHTNSSNPTEQTVPHQMQFRVDRASTDQPTMRSDQAPGTSSSGSDVKARQKRACMGRWHSKQDPPARLSSTTSQGPKSSSKKDKTSASDAEYGRPLSRSTADGSGCKPGEPSILATPWDHQQRRRRLCMPARAGGFHCPFRAQGGTADLLTSAPVERAGANSAERKGSFLVPWRAGRYIFRTARTCVSGT